MLSKIIIIIFIIGVLLIIFILLVVMMVDKNFFEDLICCVKYEIEFLCLYCEMCFILVCRECIFFDY